METLKKRWLDTKDFEEEFGISESTQAKWRSKGKIPFSKVGKFIKYDREKIDKWLEEHEV